MGRKGFKKILNEKRGQGVIEYILLFSGIIFTSVITFTVYSNIVTNAGGGINTSVSQTTSAMEQAIQEAIQGMGGNIETEEETIVEIPGNEIDEDGDGIILCNPRQKWKNHGRFVSCVARSVKELVASGYISEEEGRRLVSEAAQSDVGKRWYHRWWYRLYRIIFFWVD